MTRWHRSSRRESVGRSQSRKRDGHVPRVEAYETDDGMVIFDGKNPLAWVYSTVTLPIQQQA